MYVRPFRLVRVDSVTEAASLTTTEGPGAMILAGGQSLIPLINLGLATPDLLIDISHIEELSGIHESRRHVEIGAITTHREVERSPLVESRLPLLSAAIRHVGSPRVRNRGTIGGSLAHGDPAAELPLAMSVLDAEYVVSDGTDSRVLPATDFHLGFFTTELRAGELLTSVRVPKLHTGAGWGFSEFCLRAGDFAVVAVGAIVTVQGSVVVAARVAAAGVGDRPVRLVSFEERMVGLPISRIEEATRRVDEDVSPLGDADVGAEYKAHLARVLSGRAVTQACHRSTPHGKRAGRSPP
jgi:carbon-monoxide dehydrogenase medium subunit